jgi:hypothetical protein
MTSDEIFTDTLKQGSTYTLTLNLEDENKVAEDWSGWTPKMQLRTDFKDNQGVAALTLTSGSGIDMTDADTGVVIITITAAQTGALTAAYYLFDLEMTSGTTIERVLQGKFIVSKQVTD